MLAWPNAANQPHMLRPVMQAAEHSLHQKLLSCSTMHTPFLTRQEQQSLPLWGIPPALIQLSIAASHSKGFTSSPLCDQPLGCNLPWDRDLAIGLECHFSSLAWHLILLMSIHL